MCNCRSNRKYSLLTLSPNSEEDSKAYWDFRCNDIVTMSNIQLIVVGVYMVTYLLALIDGFDPVLMLLLLIMLLLSLSILLIRKRTAKYFVYMLPLLSVMFYIIDLRSANADMKRI